MSHPAQSTLSRIKGPLDRGASAPNGFSELDSLGRVREGSVAGWAAGRSLASASGRAPPAGPTPWARCSLSRFPAFDRFFLLITWFPVEGPLTWRGRRHRLGSQSP